MKTTKKNKNFKGFTLVELIIVIAIIAVLAAVLAPQYLQYVERTRQSNDLQVATHLMRAATVAIADPALQIPAGVIIEVAWSTDDNGALPGSVFVRSPVDASSLTRAGMPAIEENHAALSGVDESISLTLSAKLGSQNSGAINDYYPAMIDGAQSNLGNTVDFIFHINSSTGEVAIADHCMIWATEIGVQVA